MKTSGTLLAWIAPHGDEYVAAIVGAGALHGRTPATQTCKSQSRAIEWVQEEAAAVDLPVEWLEAAPSS
jgi:hypothetical protein